MESILERNRRGPRNDFIRIAPSQSFSEEPAVRLNLPGDAELLRELHAESLELLQSIEQGLLVLEEIPTDADTIHTIFRAFHTLKGGAGLFHLEALRDLAHDLESLLDAARRSELSINSEIINLILAGGDDRLIQLSLVKRRHV